VRKVDAVIFEDYAKGFFSPEFTRQLIASVKKSGKPLLVDPNVRMPVRCWRNVDVLKPNKKEAEFFSGMSIFDRRSLCRAGFEILKQSAARYVVITLGKDGMAIFSEKSGQYFMIPTEAREVYDVSGAGDTIIAVLALAIVAGGDIEESGILANIAAGVEVGKRGTSTVSLDEVLIALGD